MCWAGKVSGLTGDYPIPGRIFLRSVRQPDIVACVPSAGKAISSDTYQAVIDAGSALFSSLRALLLWPAPLRLPSVPRIDAAEPMLVARRAAFWKRPGRHAERPGFDPTTLTEEFGLRLPSGGAFLAGAAISPSRIACLRASFRDRLTASAFFFVILSEGFS